MIACSGGGFHMSRLISIWTERKFSSRTSNTGLVTTLGGGRSINSSGCFQRWFILRDYMLKRGVRKALFADGDSIIVRNVTEMCDFEGRKHCSAAVNVEANGGNYKWTRSHSITGYYLFCFICLVYIIQYNYIISGYLRYSKADISLLSTMTCLCSSSRALTKGARSIGSSRATPRAALLRYCGAVMSCCFCAVMSCYFAAVLLL
jgi:hypothetical protein